MAKKEVNLSACTAQAGEIMRFLYPKYRRNRLTAQRAGGGYNDQSNYCYA